MTRLDSTRLDPKVPLAELGDVKGVDFRWLLEEPARGTDAEAEVAFERRELCYTRLTSLAKEIVHSVEIVIEDDVPRLLLDLANSGIIFYFFIHIILEPWLWCLVPSHTFALNSYYLTLPYTPLVIMVDPFSFW